MGNCPFARVLVNWASWFRGAELSSQRSLVSGFRWNDSGAVVRVPKGRSSESHVRATIVLA